MHILSFDQTRLIHVLQPHAGVLARDRGIFLRLGYVLHTVSIFYFDSTSTSQ